MEFYSTFYWYSKECKYLDSIENGLCVVLLCVVTAYLLGVVQAQTTPDGKLNLQGFKVEVKKAKSQDEMRGFNRGGGGMGRGGGGGGRGG